MLSRRTFLRHAAACALVPPALGGLVAACGSVGRTAELRSAGRTGGRGAGRRARGYGPLLEPDGDSPVALPAGFEARAFGRVGDPLSDGFPTPIAHDGMAVFEVGDRLRLVRNHEDANPAGAVPPIGGGARAYDPRAGGGTTTVELDRDGRVLASFVSLEGTIVNCAGGPTPHGTWLSCEERTGGPSEGFARPHGYVFEVPAEADGPVEPRPIRAMGRFRHEAVAVDPRTGHVYLTEDNAWSPGDPRVDPGSGFYRFRPAHSGDYLAGGVLEALRVRGEPGVHLFRFEEPFVELEVEWVPIPHPDPAEADTLSVPRRDALVFLQGLERGAAAFARLEGCWFGDGRVFFHDTRGGANGKGQVWQYDPQRESLTLIFTSPGVEVLDSPDNITVSPRGQVVICEDGGGAQYLRGLTRRGEIFELARNALNRSEFAGACFSPDGETLFVNIQGTTTGRPENAPPGVTLAIRGPWRDGPL